MASNQFRFTEIAIADFEGIVSYICFVLENPQAAKAFYNKMCNVIKTLCLFPSSCPLVENDFISKVQIRKAFVDKYILYYLYEEAIKTITILRVVFARRNQSEIIKSIE